MGEVHVMGCNLQHKAPPPPGLFFQKITKKRTAAWWCGVVGREVCRAGNVCFAAVGAGATRRALCDIWRWTNRLYPSTRNCFETSQFIYRGSGLSTHSCPAQSQWLIQNMARGQHRQAHRPGKLPPPRMRRRRQWAT